MAKKVKVDEVDLAIEQPDVVANPESVSMQVSEVAEGEKISDEALVEYESKVFDNRHVKLAVGLVIRGSHDDMIIETHDGVTLCAISAPARTFPAFV